MLQSFKQTNYFEPRHAPPRRQLCQQLHAIKSNGHHSGGPQATEIAVSRGHDQGFDTVCLHGGHDREGSHRAHITPIYASSTYTFDSAEQAQAVFKGEENGFVYARFELWQLGDL